MDGCVQRAGVRVCAVRARARPRAACVRDLAKHRTIAVLARSRVVSNESLFPLTGDDAVNADASLSGWCGVSSREGFFFRFPPSLPPSTPSISLGNLLSCFLIPSHPPPLL